jgi:hypothetical protein
MSLNRPQRNQILPLAIQKRLNEMYARDKGFSGPEMLEFFAQYSLDIESYPWQGGAPSRYQIFEDCLSGFDLQSQRAIIQELIEYLGPMRHGQPSEEDKQFIRNWLNSTGTPSRSVASQKLPISQLIHKRETLPNPARDVFLCHAGPDKQRYVRPLAKELERMSISYWLDEGEISWGDPITQKINQGLAYSRYVLVFLSDSFLSRNWPQVELNTAMNLEVSNGLVVVLPVMIASAEIVFQFYPILRDKNYVDARNGPAVIAEKLSQLLR